MKYVEGHTKADYRNGETVKEFGTIQAAAEYISQKYGHSVQDAIEGILNDTNCDAIYFEDGSVIINECKTTPAQRRAVQKYKKEKAKRFSIDFSQADAELLEHIQNQPNKQGYIKSLIRADMERGGDQK